MNREQFLNWLEQIYTTKDAEIDCDRLQALLPAHVDFEINGENLPDEQLAGVRTHLAQCPDCAEEYEALRTVALLEAEGGLPDPEESLARFEEAETAPYAGD